MKSESGTKSPRFLQISVWLLQAHRLRRTCWLLVHSKVTLIRRFWLDEISYYLYVHWSIRNIIHMILFIDFVRKRKWNQVNTSYNQTMSNFTECYQMTNFFSYIMARTSFIIFVYYLEMLIGWKRVTWRSIKIKDFLLCQYVIYGPVRIILTSVNIILTGPYITYR
jgi:hypothetical protein